MGNPSRGSKGTFHARLVLAGLPGVAADANLWNSGRDLPAMIIPNTNHYSGTRSKLPTYWNFIPDQLLKQEEATQTSSSRVHSELRCMHALPWHTQREIARRWVASLQQSAHPYKSLHTLCYSIREPQLRHASFCRAIRFQKVGLIEFVHIG